MDLIFGRWGWSDGVLVHNTPTWLGFGRIGRLSFETRVRMQGGSLLSPEKPIGVSAVNSIEHAARSYLGRGVWP